MTRTDQWHTRNLNADGSAGGLSLAALECSGSADLAPVILLHGAGGNALTWMAIAPAFAGRRVLLLDMPAHGNSATPSRWDLAATAATITRAVQPWYGDQPVIWGGHSWGGKVAGIIAASAPERCHALVLVDPSPSSAVPIDVEAFVDDIWSVEMQRFRSPETAAEAAKSLRHWQPWDEVSRAAFRHGLAQRSDGNFSLRPTREELVALATATLHFDAGEILAGASTVPTLLLVAEESSAWQGITNMLVYANATQQVIAGNHWIHQCSREAVMAAISGWLAQLDG